MFLIYFIVIVVEVFQEATIAGRYEYWHRSWFVPINGFQDIFLGIYRCQLIEPPLRSFNFELSDNQEVIEIQ